jgi:hypothetical protein
MLELRGPFFALLTCPTADGATGRSCVAWSPAGAGSVLMEVHNDLFRVHGTVAPDRHLA